MAADENTGRLRVEDLHAAGIHTVEDLLFRMETLERSDVWVYVACDHDEDGNLKLVTATGFYEDEASAMLAGTTYCNQQFWQEDDAPLPITFAIPLFIEKEAPRG